MGVKSMKIHPRYRRTWAWAVLVTVLLASLASLALFLVARRGPQTQIAKSIDSRPVAVRVSQESARSRMNAVAQRAVVRTPPPPAIVDDLCGVRGPYAERAGDETVAQHVMRTTKTVISRWQRTLAASDDLRSRAIGVALEDAHPAAPGNEPQDTPVNNSIVLSAIESNDPVIYALALSRCEDGYEMAAGPCQGLSWEHWASIDPDNAAPWLWIAAKADDAGDQQGVEEALAKAAIASRFDSYTSTVAAIALGALARDVAPLDKAVAGIDVISTRPIAIPAADLTARLCSDVAVQQPLRKQQCTSIANDLANGGSTVFDLGVAWSLGKTLGFPADRQANLQMEYQSAVRALLAHNPWRYAAEGSDLDERSHLVVGSDFHCDTVLGYDAFIDALQATGGSERAALAVVGRAAQGTK